MNVGKVRQANACTLGWCDRPSTAAGGAGAGATARCITSAGFAYSLCTDNEGRDTPSIGCSLPDYCFWQTCVALGCRILLYKPKPTLQCFFGRWTTFHKTIETKSTKRAFVLGENQYSIRILCSLCQTVLNLICSKYYWISLWFRSLSVRRQPCFKAGTHLDQCG